MFIKQGNGWGNSQLVAATGCTLRPGWGLEVVPPPQCTNPYCATHQPNAAAQLALDLAMARMQH